MSAVALVAGGAVLLGGATFVAVYGSGRKAVRPDQVGAQRGTDLIAALGALRDDIGARRGWNAWPAKLPGINGRLDPHMHAADADALVAWLTEVFKWAKNVAPSNVGDLGAALDRAGVLDAEVEFVEDLATLRRSFLTDLGLDGAKAGPNARFAGLVAELGLVPLLPLNTTARLYDLVSTQVLALNSLHATAGQTTWSLAVSAFKAAGAELPGKIADVGRRALDTAGDWVFEFVKVLAPVLGFVAGGVAIYVLGGAVAQRVKAS